MSRAYIFVETGEPREPVSGDIIDPCGNGMFTVLGCGAACMFTGKAFQCYRRIEVEVPTKLDAEREWGMTHHDSPGVWMAGAQWLASKLGLTLD